MNQNNQNKKIIDEFTMLIEKTRSDRDKGFGFKIKNFQKVINILNQYTGEVTDTYSVLEVLRKYGMKLPNEQPPNWKSKILININKIITQGTLGIELSEKSIIIKTLTSIPGIGDSKAITLYEKGVKSLDDLRNDPTLINSKQRIGLRHYGDLKQKIPRNEMIIWENSLKDTISKLILKEYPEIEIIYMELVGSYRRGKLESGDIDFYLALSECPKKLMNSIADKLIKEKYINSNDFFSKGEKKLMAVATLGLGNICRHLDIFIYPKKEAPFALLYATGSGEYNIKMRNYAINKGYSLSDKGLLIGNNKGQHVGKEEIYKKIGKNTIENEQDIFTFLGLTYLEPCDRLPDASFN